MYINDCNDIITLHRFCSKKKLCNDSITTLLRISEYRGFNINLTYFLSFPGSKNYKKYRVNETEIKINLF